MASERRKSSRKTTSPKEAPPPPGLDRIDQRILRVLQGDGRISNLKLAQTVHLSPTAVLERVKRLTREGFNTFNAAVQARPEILECHLVAGGFDYLIKVRVADMSAYRELIGSIIWALPGVRETHTYAVMEEVKNTAHLPL